MPKEKITTMEAFARACGISRPTVSKYFSDPDRVRNSTRKRIQQAQEIYDYRPNIFAINQNRRSTKNIGILVPSLVDPFFAEIARNIERRCIESGYWPILMSAHGQSEFENQALESLHSLKLAGALIAPLGRASDLKSLQRIADEVPTVIFDSDVDVGDAFVGSDNNQSIDVMVDYLTRTGEPPCFFEMPPVNPNGIKRRQAYTQSMERLGHEPKIVHVPGDGWDFERVGYLEGMRLIEGHLLPSNTVLCSNDRMAIGLLAAAYEKGLQVGRGAGCAMRIAGHDDHPWSQYTCPSLTTVSQNYEAIADCSVETLFRVLNTEERSQVRETMLFEGRLVLRSSA